VVHNQSDAISTQRDKYCFAAKGVTTLLMVRSVKMAAHVKGACQDTCDVYACEDYPITTFPLKNQENCAWIAKKNVANRQGNYCYDTVDPSAVSDI